MHEGWLMNLSDQWTYRFHRDEKSWVRDQKVFVGMGRPMPDGSPVLLKTRNTSRERTPRSSRRTWSIWGGRGQNLSGVLLLMSDFLVCVLVAG